MSASTIQRSSREQNGTVFSYAQAAKGRSPSVPNTALKVEKPEAKRAASEGQAGSVDDLKAQHDSDAVSQTKSNSKKTSPPSSPSSPEYGMASVSTIPKEEDLSTTQNGSSESTWDKQSQMSQNGAKDSEKAESGKPDSDSTSWADDTPAPVCLRDAPPPAVNFWDQRKELMQAKVKASKPAPAQLTKVSEASILPEPSNASKIAIGGPEAKRSDSQKKPKTNFAPMEANTTHNNSKDWSKANDGKPKLADEGMLVI